MPKHLFWKTSQLLNHHYAVFVSYIVLSQLRANTFKKYLFSYQQTLKSNLTNPVLTSHLQSVTDKKHQQQILQHVPLHNISPILSEDQADNRGTYINILLHILYPLLSNTTQKEWYKKKQNSRKKQYKGGHICASHEMMHSIPASIQAYN